MIKWYYTIEKGLEKEKGIKALRVVTKSIISFLGELKNNII